MRAVQMCRFRGKLPPIFNAAAQILPWLRAARTTCDTRRSIDEVCDLRPAPMRLHCCGTTRCPGLTFNACLGGRHGTHLARQGWRCAILCLPKLATLIERCPLP